MLEKGSCALEMDFFPLYGLMHSSGMTSWPRFPKDVLVLIASPLHSLLSPFRSPGLLVHVRVPVQVKPPTALFPLFQLQSDLMNFLFS